MKFLDEFAEYYFRPDDRDWFADGGWKSVFVNYRQLFDKDDDEVLKSQARMPDGKRYKFFECLAAIRLFEEYGHLSLLEKYALPKGHKRKKEVVHRLNSPELNEAVDYLQNNHAGHGPDLLVYSPNLTEWYFVEAKSPDDKRRATQDAKFAKLYEITGKRIRLVGFTPRADAKGIQESD